MPIKIPRSLVEFILLGPEDDRRQLQDSPILGDVWVEFAKNPAQRLELLITPYKETSAGAVARTLLETLPPATTTDQQTDIAYLQGIVAARLTFEEILRVVLPITSWWSDPRIATLAEGLLHRTGRLEAELAATRAEAEKWLAGTTEISIQDIETRRRYAALAGLILWAAEQPDDKDAETLSAKDQARRIVEKLNATQVGELANRLQRVFADRAPTSKTPLVWTISLNRRGTPAVTRSMPAVKADAARTLFTVNCSELVWAVIDSGIDATHVALQQRDGKASRVKRTFDFTRIRDIVTLDNLMDTPGRRARVARLIDRTDRSHARAEDAAHRGRGRHQDPAPGRRRARGPADQLGTRRAARRARSGRRASR